MICEAFNMRLGIMQPYFFPYLGYFDCINRVDRWIVFDVAQYTPKSWMTRNRMPKRDVGWQYIHVPVSKTSRADRIKDVMLKEPDKALLRIERQLFHLAAAPFFDKVMDILRTSFEHRESDSLTDLNVSALTVVCRYLSINFNYAICSRLSNLVLPPIQGPGDWALEISTALRAKTYINPPGGRELFDKEAFKKRGIELEFTQNAEFGYERPGYENAGDNLSILDVILWTPPERIKAHLDLLALQINNKTGQ